MALSEELCVWIIVHSYAWLMHNEKDSSTSTTPYHHNEQTASFEIFKIGLKIINLLEQERLE